MKFINLTPHTITLNDGSSFPTEGNARVADTYTRFNGCGICKVKHGEIEGLQNLRKMSHTSSPPWFSQQRRRMVEQMWLPPQQDTRSVNEKTASSLQYRDSSANDSHWLIYDKVQK